MIIRVKIRIESKVEVQHTQNPASKPEKYENDPYTFSVLNDRFLLVSFDM